MDCDQNNEYLEVEDRIEVSSEEKIKFKVKEKSLNFLHLDPTFFIF